MNCRQIVAVSVCGAGLSIASLAVAQQAQPNATQVQQAQGQAGSSGQRNPSKNSDQMLATCVAIGNQEEVAIAKFAGEKAHHQDVKDFAAMLVKDHQSFLQKLQRFAPEATRDGYLMEKETTTNNGNERASSAQPKATVAQAKVQPAAGKVQPAGGEAAAAKGEIQQTAGTRENSESQPLDIVQLHRELAEECIHSAKQGLSKKEGAEFDECFIGHQIAMHAGMKNKLVVFERHVSRDLKQVFADGIETTEKHMKKAEEIMKKLADSESSNSKKERREERK